jgi:Arc/MetJ family transcription regulator
MDMRTNIVIDDELMAEVMEVTGIRTKREAVEMGLKALLRLKKQESIRKYRGKLDWQGEGEDVVAIGDLMLAEVLQGFRTDSDYRKAKELLLSLTVLNMLDTDIALKGAANFRSLRKKGVTVRKTIDTIIATYCIENRLPLLHSDRDFQPFHDFLRLKDALDV